jgi:hypothetical protein
MAIKRSEPLPVAQPSYDKPNEDMTRRIIQNNLNELRVDVERMRVQDDKPATLAMRRVQFLLMGAS